VSPRSHHQSLPIDNLLSGSSVNFSRVRDIGDDLHDHRARPVESLVFSDTGDLFASYPTGVV